MISPNSNQEFDNTLDNHLMHSSSHPRNILTQMEQDSDDSIENEDEDSEDDNQHECANLCRNDTCMKRCEQTNKAEADAQKISDKVDKDASHDTASHDKLRHSRVFSKHDFS